MTVLERILEATTPDFHPRSPRSIPSTGDGFCDSQRSPANLWLKLHLVFSCTWWILAASLVNIFYFYLIKMKNLTLSKLFLAFIWPLNTLYLFQSSN